MPVHFSAESWSAVASCCSAAAACISLYGVFAALKQSKRAANAAEEALRQQMQPIISPRIVERIEHNLMQVRVHLVNVGRGLALTSLAFPLPEFDEENSEQFSDQFTPMPDASQIVAIDSGRPIDPGGTASIDVALPKVNGCTAYVIAYVDGEGDALQCRFRVLVNAEGRLAMNIIGYSRRKRKKS